MSNLVYREDEICSTETLTNGFTPMKAPTFRYDNNITNLLSGFDPTVVPDLILL